MGFFDDFSDITGLINDYKSIKKELIDTGTQIVKEIVTEAQDVKKTVVETAQELKTEAEDVKQTVADTAGTFKDEAIELQSVVKQSTTINVTHITQTADDSAPADNQAA